MSTPLSLEAKVAQRFMLGFEGTEPNPVTRRFLQAGLGGLIFFRDNFQPHPSAQAARDWLDSIRALRPPALPALLLGIDQEGGLVERLPHTYFPTALSPMAVALSQDADGLAEAMYGMMASHLADLGLNLNFFPTLDVNLEHRNPIIGVRAFSDAPGPVSRLAGIAMRQLERYGIVPVGKHFPGHGNGTVDSHLDLPTLRITDTELRPFGEAIQAGLPAMLVAHGYYPDLQDPAGEAHLPSSAAPTIIQGLLRERLGFEGVILTDDMCMGAITRHRDAVEAALLAVKAGVDILLYKQSTEAEWAVYQALLDAYRTGHLPEAELDASVARILRLKCRLQAPNDRPPAKTQPPDTLALQIARQGVTVLKAGRGLSAICPQEPLLLMHPDRGQMGNYAFDGPTSPDLPEVFARAGFTALKALAYPAREGKIRPTWPESAPHSIVLITFNPGLHPGQVALYRQLKNRWPDTPLVVVSAGTPYDAEALGTLDSHIALCSYRPASMQALAEALFNAPRLAESGAAPA